MSSGGSELHRFGIDPDSPPDARQWENVCKFLKALLNNPNLQIGNSNSAIIFPDPVPPPVAAIARSEDPPFTVRLITTTGASPTYKVSVGWGYVCERIPGSGDAVEYHEAANMWDAADATKLRKFAITAGQAVYIKVHVNSDGLIAAPGGDDAVAIVVASDETASVHYRPEVDTDTTAGGAGYMYYKLAVLKAPVAPSTQPKLEKWLSGSHLDHYQDLPSIRSTLGIGAGVGVIPKEWSDGAKAYRLRALSKGLGQLTITTNSDHVEVRGTRKDSDVIVWRGNSSESPLLAFRDGLETTGATVIGNEDPAVNPTDKDIYVPTVVGRGGATEQIKVTNIGNPGYVYKVEGNGKDGTLTYTIGGGSAQPLLAWIDGLVTNEGAINIPIPESGNGSGGSGGGGGASGNVLFQWKTTKATATTIDIAEGKVYTQAGFTGTTAAAAFGRAVSASGFAICTITRNASTRAITSAVSSYVTGTPAESTYTTQIVPLAQVIFTSGAIEKIIQLKFEELHIFEDLVIENGEFRLADLLMAGRNIYEPPP